MAERRLLTEEFVNAVEPPPRGEKWIADTEVRGFGLRLWRTTTGEGKAFGIRVANADGRVVRRTYTDRAHVGFWFGRYERHLLGKETEDAREWARDEIDKAKSRKTRREEYREQRAGFEKAFARLTL